MYASGFHANEVIPRENFSFSELPYHAPSIHKVHVVYINANTFGMVSVTLVTKFLSITVIIQSRPYNDETYFKPF